MKTETVAGIEYTKPQVYLLNDSGLGVAEFAGRTAYNSFDKSENGVIKGMNFILNENIQPKHVIDSTINDLKDIKSSKLLEQLTWVHFHESVLEHINFSFLVKGTSRAVLQELSRHRIASPTVQSTRYTMSPIINAFVASVFNNKDIFNHAEWFINKILEQDVFIIDDYEYNRIEAHTIFSKLLYQMNIIGRKEFIENTLAKSAIPLIENKEPLELFEILQSGKQKRNVGDSFKHIVTDNWKVDLVVTVNLRSLKNFLNLRDSGSAYFQMQWLAQEMKKSLPDKYLPLINKQ